MRIVNAPETIIVAVFLVIGNVGACVYAAFGAAPSAAFLFLYYVGIFWAMAAWTIADARRLAVDVPFDLGWFVFLGWPVALPYHLFKTRGVRGFLPLILFLLLFVAAYLIGLAVYFVITTAYRA